MAVLWEAELDPSDKLDFVANFIGGDEPVLEDGETITDFNIVLSEGSVNSGLIVETEAEYAASLVSGDTAVLLWLSVSPALQALPQFKRGVTLDVSVRIQTSEGRTFEKTWQIRVKQQ